MLEARQLLALLQLASPTLPVGAYSYSQGLESAVDAGIVRDEPTASRWIGDALEWSIGRLEAPIFLRLANAWAESDGQAVHAWTERFIASRDTAELRAETLQMGYSLVRLLRDLGRIDAARASVIDPLTEVPFPTAFALAAVTMNVSSTAALHAYLFGWTENQVLAALKAVPLGQVSGQRMLLAIADRIPAIADAAAAMKDDEIGAWTPGLSLASMKHETQYSRIFRS